MSGLEETKIRKLLEEKGLLVKDIEEAAKLLEDEILTFPTDTLLGLLTNAFNKKTVEKIFKLKKRDENKPLLLLTDDFNKVKDFLEIKKFQHFFIEEWPNTLTLIFNVKEDYLNELKYLHRGTNKLAIRIPKDKDLLTLLSKLDFPVVAPSANLQGQKPASNLKEAFVYFGENVYYYDFNKIKNILPSTIIDISELPFKTIRQGVFNKKFACFKFRGHKNIRAKHLYTFEITKEDYLTEKGTCIVGVVGFSNKEFQEIFKELKEKTKLRFFVVCNNYLDKGVGYLVKPKNPSEVSFVVRRSNFVDERTGLIKSNKTSSTLNRNLVYELKKGTESWFLIKEISLNKIFIDFFVFFSDNDLEFLNKRLKRRLSFEKDEDLFCKDKINILKKEKMFQYLGFIKEKLREVNLIERFEKIIENIKEIHYFEEELKIVFLFRPLFFEGKDLDLFLDQKIIERLKKVAKEVLNKNILIRKSLFDKEIMEKDLYKTLFISRNEYLLKKAKKKGATTFGFKNKYFIDQIIQR
jgi:L-threonylcarbamoyladenylate synthase